MGRALLAESPVFAETVAACEAAFVELHGSGRFASVLCGDEGVEAALLELNETAYTQPALVCDERGAGGGVA